MSRTTYDLILKEKVRRQLGVLTTPSPVKFKHLKFLLDPMDKEVLDAMSSDHCWIPSKKNTKRSALESSRISKRKRNRKYSNF